MPPKRLKEVIIGSATVTLAQTPKGFVGAVFEGGQRKTYEEGEDADEIWQRLLDAARRLNPLFFGYDGARARFLHFFPGGFSDPGYIGQERSYKLTAKEKLDQSAPLDRATTGTGFGEAVLSAFRATNLLFRIEKTKLQSVLRGPNADEFVQAAAAFALGDIKQALATMKSVLKQDDSAKWTVVTYLPFLWQPDAHIFLKPSMISAFAERVGHPFKDVYTAELDASVYESLLDLAATTRDQIADMHPQDMMDIQSFMWTAVEYTEADRPKNE